MEHINLKKYLSQVIENMPTGWLDITTHRLDIYDEKQAKSEFLNEFENLYNNQISDSESLNQLPTAYDYIRLGHPLSCVLEWAIAKIQQTNPAEIISFDSQTVPLLAVLRTNLLANKNTRILYTKELPAGFDEDTINRVYGYSFELNQIENLNEIEQFDGSTVLISSNNSLVSVLPNPNVDFHLNLCGHLGSILLINRRANSSYTSDIQHVRRRETIAMTPINSLVALKSLVTEMPFEKDNTDLERNKKSVLASIKKITEAYTKALVGSSGLSVQYAIMMGLIEDAQKAHPGKEIKFIVPTNCYGGTNDQARRVAACNKMVEVVDLAVDGDNNMVQSIENVLNKIATEDAVPYIIAEIPTNPRVEVPHMVELKNTLSKPRKTATGETAIDPVFILDQTFCPNLHFLGEGEILSAVRTISYASGSKFPSGGKCTAGYCVGNKKAAALMPFIEKHLLLCDNEATHLQWEILAKQLPSMNHRIADAYANTREFVTYIKETLPAAKINFVSEELAAQGFTPSVFSLDLPTKGETPEEKEAYKRALNHTLINLMITKIPNESKYCVSYGQLKGCYWTIPATSTQGTTKEGDKDYIARVALSGDMDLELHKQVFLEFVNGIN